ncbi:uncharacterized protein LOC141665589 [Apium graveolens]|uniref:uncharacterized protein LOC141665589 n=1 Tax=Apium graveolens TaxID=4045 RepID=UPI003D7930F2
MCHGEEETILHALVTCPRAVQIWNTVLSTSDIYQETREDFFSWVQGIFESTSHDMRAKVATLCWGIWKARNEKVWNNKISSVNGVLSSAVSYLTQWKSTQSRFFEALPQAGCAEDGAMSWVKPHEDSVKINVDAALFREHDLFGSGLVARDSNGGLIQARTILKEGKVTVEMAEAMSIKEALSWIEESQWSEVVLESDCLVAVQAIRSKVKMRSPFGLVIEECRNKLLSLNNVSLLFVRRSANMTAHYVAKMSYSFPGRVFDRENVPIEIKNVLMTDLMI